MGPIFSINSRNTPFEDACRTSGICPLQKECLYVTLLWSWKAFQMLFAFADAYSFYSRVTVFVGMDGIDSEPF